MIFALVVFAATYVAMLAWPERRPLAALTGAAIFVVMGQMGVYQLSLGQALAAVDFNVLLMIAGTMGTVSLFIESKMPLRLAEQLIRHVPGCAGRSDRAGAVCRRDPALLWTTWLRC